MANAACSNIFFPRAIRCAPAIALLAITLSACMQTGARDDIARSLEEQQAILRTMLEVQQLQMQALAQQTQPNNLTASTQEEEVKQSVSHLMSALAAFYQSITGEAWDPGTAMTTPNPEAETSAVDEDYGTQATELAAAPIVQEKPAPQQKAASPKREAAPQRIEQQTASRPQPAPPPQAEAAQAKTSKVAMELSDATREGMADAARLPREEWWVLAEGEPFHDQIFRWAGEAEWKVVWKSEYEYPIEASAVFTGPFPEAVRQAVHALKDVYPPIHVTFYQNRVAVVENLDGNY